MALSLHLDSPRLTGACTLRDLCPGKTNGDSLNLGLLRPHGAINNTGPLQVSEP